MNVSMTFVGLWQKHCPEWSKEELLAHIVPPAIDEKCDVQVRDVEKFRGEISALGKDAFAALLRYCLRLFAKDMVLCVSEERGEVVPHWCDNAFALLVSDGNRFNGFIVDVARRLGGEEVARAVGSSSLVCTDLASVCDGMVYSLAARMIENDGIELDKNLLPQLELRARRIEVFTCWLTVAFGLEDLAGASRGTLADADKVSLRRFVVAQWNPYDTRFQGDHATPTTAFDAFSKSLTNRFRVRSTDVRNAIFTVSDKGKRQATCSSLKNKPPIQLSEKFLKAHKPFFSREGNTGNPVKLAYCLVPRAMVELSQFEHVASIVTVGNKPLLINAANPVRLALQNPLFDELIAGVWGDMWVWFADRVQANSMDNVRRLFETILESIENAEAHDIESAREGRETCFADLARLRCISFLVQAALAGTSMVNCVDSVYEKGGNTPTIKQDPNKQQSSAPLLVLSRVHSKEALEMRIGFLWKTGTLSLEGENTGKRELVIGRKDDKDKSDISVSTLSCRGLSRQHAVFSYDQKSKCWQVRDNASKNGSVLSEGEGWRLLDDPDKDVPLCNGATLVLGSGWAGCGLRRGTQPDRDSGLWLRVEVEDGR